MTKHEKIIRNAFLVFVISVLFFIFSWCYAHKERRNLHYRRGMQDFVSKAIIYNEEVDEYIEKNYFKDNVLKNGDFSNGLLHWGTSGSSNDFTVNKREYFSKPYCLQVDVNEFPARLYYVKKKQFMNFKFLPWSYHTAIAWLGVNP